VKVWVGGVIRCVTKSWTPTGPTDLSSALEVLAMLEDNETMLLQSVGKHKGNDSA
jgi:hypothetical protein